jgi:hypothetical protein
LCGFQSEFLSGGAACGVDFLLERIRFAITRDRSYSHGSSALIITSGESGNSTVSTCDSTWVSQTRKAYVFAPPHAQSPPTTTKISELNRRGRNAFCTLSRLSLRTSEAVLPLNVPCY